jgi:CRP/FNR family transcriptional regulator/CRP/FNR family cyclic AMP-dependent transcriptional regulator
MPQSTKDTRDALVDELLKGEGRELLSAARRVVFQPGQEVLAQGRPNGSLFVVEDGVLHVRRIRARREVFLGRLERGSIFGELSLFDPAPTSASVRAMSDGSLLEISRECLDEFLVQQPGPGVRLLRTILRHLAARLRHADERIADAVV